MVFLGHQSVLSCGSFNCSFGGAGELEMRLRLMEVGKVGKIPEMKDLWEEVEVGGSSRTRVDSEKMELHEEGGEDLQRLKRGIFMRDNVALARSLPSERCKPVFSFSCFKLFGLTLITSTPESRL